MRGFRLHFWGRTGVQKKEKAGDDDDYSCEDESPGGDALLEQRAQRAGCLYGNRYEKGVCWTGTPGTSREYGLAWLERRLPVARVIEGEEVEPLRRAIDQLRRYFAGERVQFSCPLDLRGTPFQVAVWQELYRIPYGSTRTYSQIAEAIGHPKAVRAVGAANGANPVAVIVPCHRVIGSNGTLTGYPAGTKCHSKRLAEILPELTALFSPPAA